LATQLPRPRIPALVAPSQPSLSIMTIRTCSKHVRAAICPFCGSCRVPITCPLAADGLSKLCNGRCDPTPSSAAKSQGWRFGCGWDAARLCQLQRLVRPLGARYAPQQDRLPRKVYGEMARGQPHAAAQRCGPSRRRQSTAPSGRVGSPQSQPPPAPAARPCRNPTRPPTRPDARRTVGACAHRRTTPM
jgi:hypothetical protein